MTREGERKLEIFSGYIRLLASPGFSLWCLHHMLFSPKSIMRDTRELEVSQDHGYGELGYGERNHLDASVHDLVSRKLPTPRPDLMEPSPRYNCFALAPLILQIATTTTRSSIDCIHGERRSPQKILNKLNLLLP